MDWLKKKLSRNTDPSRTHPHSRISSPIQVERWRSGDPPARQPRVSQQDHKNALSSENELEEGDSSPLPLIWPGSPTIQFLSDLHLEKTGYASLSIPRSAPYLLLAGDIGLLRHSEQYLSFLRHQCEIFDLVLLVLGNHEFYGISREEGLEIAARFEAELKGKLVVLNRRQVDLPDGRTIVLDCTLHSHIPDDYTALTNDFAQIKNWSVQNHNSEHSTDKTWLKQSLSSLSSSSSTAPSNLAKRVIITTHYAPSFTRTTHPKHEHDAYSHCFCSCTLAELETWSGSEKVFAWVSGHTHYNSCFKSQRGGIWHLSNHLENQNLERPFNVSAVM